MRTGYLALDSGGTKIAGVLYDGDLRRQAVAVCGSVRGNTTDAALVQKHTQDLFAALDLPGRHLAAVGGTCEPGVIDALKNVCTVERVALTNEFDVGLAAAGLFGDGLLAICGTGSTLFGRIGQKVFVAGGYGAAVADEGSGYWIGRQAYLAAIRDREGRGPRTALTDVIARSRGVSGREELDGAIRALYDDGNRSPTAAVAHATPLVVTAAEQGDAVARDILIQAATLLFGQLRFMVRRHAVPESVALTVSGSVWRHNPLFLETFTALVRQEWPSRPLVLPRLEPVLGVLARQRFETTGRFSPDDAAALAAQYPEFAYDIHSVK